MRRSVIVLVALLISCPLFSWPGTGYDALRLPAVLALSAALLAAAFLRSARGGERPPGPAPLRTAALLLLAAHLVSLLAARSIADASAPLLLLVAGVSIFSVLRAGLLDREAARSLLPVLSAVGLVFAGIGIVQRLAGREPVSTEGNRNYAGAVAAILLPVTAALTRTGSTRSRILAGVAAVHLLVLLLLTESRGGLLAAASGLGVAGAAMGAKRVRHGIVAASVALLALLGAFALFQANRQLSAERMQTAGFRRDVWKSGLRMLAARPVLGWGVGGFAAEYPPFRSEAEFRYSHLYVTDAFKELEDAHSSWVQTAVETGALGLLAFLLLVYVAARLWRYYVKIAPDSDASAALAALGGGAAAWLVAGFFNTLTLKTSPTILFWVLLGLIEVLGERRPWRHAARSREWKVAVPAAAAFVAFFGALWAGAMGMADAAFNAGMGSSRAAAREPALRESLDVNPFSWRARYELSLTLAAMGRLKGAAEEGRATLRLRPHHLDALNHTAVCLLRSGGDPKEAESLFLHAIEVAPYYYKSLHNLALFERHRGNRAEARKWFTRAIEMNPAYEASFYCRGMLAYSGGELAMALEDFRKARSLGFDVAAALRAESPSAENDSGLAEFFR